MHNYINLGKPNSSEFLLLTGDGKNGLNHLKHWVPEFLKTKVKFSILVRSKELFKLVQKEYRMLDVLLAESALDVEAILSDLSCLKAIFFMSNPSNNIHVLRFNNYKHIFLGSDNSDRDAQVTKIFRAYDELWLSSQSSIDKIKSKINIEDLVVRKIGKPQFKELLESFYKQSPKSVLIVASSENNIYSISNILVKIINSIPEDLHIKIVLDQSINSKNILFKDFKSQLNEFNWIKGRNCKIYDSLMDDFIANSDYIICDINNYQQKFLAADALICLYTPNSISPETLFENKYISFEGIAQFSIEDELECIFTEYENLYMRQKEFSEYWLGNSYTMKDEFAANLQQLSVI